MKQKELLKHQCDNLGKEIVVAGATVLAVRVVRNDQILDIFCGQAQWCASKG